MEFFKGALNTHTGSFVHFPEASLKKEITEVQKGFGCVPPTCSLSTMSFPEELSPTTDGPGYFTATIHQKLFKGKYEIIRKLGYGPRCSTWLVWDEFNNRYFAAQIFTIASSERALKVEIPILEVVRKIDSSTTLPWIQNHFWESGYHGSHLCVIHNPKSNSVEALHLGEKTQRLPVHVVQRVVYCTLEALCDFHSANIMHGGTQWISSQKSFIERRFAQLSILRT